MCTCTFNTPYSMYMYKSVHVPILLFICKRICTARRTVYTNFQKMYVLLRSIHIPVSHGICKCTAQYTL